MAAPVHNDGWVLIFIAGGLEWRGRSVRIKIKGGIWRESGM